ncbi:hypothetical protein EKK58_01945 [Candidatus Dependentiae bacterium]|nr:MAG: hypothetical protein EKK58_01945 [Candidatus Dependentiae bacterium]
MKKNIFLLLPILLCIDTLYTSEAKIQQMLFVPKDDTHNQESDCIYYVTQDNKLYCKLIPALESNTKTISLESQDPLALFERADKSNDEYQPVKNNRVVLIGYPVTIKEEGDTSSIWTMPAVIKKPGILGNILRPDIYTIEYKDIKIVKYEREMEDNFSTDDDDIIYNVNDDDESSSYSDKKFAITKQYEGHRTKVVKVGITKDSQNQYNLISGSAWPTVKYIHLNSTDSTLKEGKNKFLLAINQHFYITSKESTFYVNKSNKKYSIEHLPLIIINQTILTDKDSNTTSITDSAKKTYIKIVKELEKSTIMYNYKNQPTLYKDSGSSPNAYFIYLDKKHDRILLKKNNFNNYFFSYRIDKHHVCTAHDFDFTSKTLYYALYNIKEKNTFIKFINISTIENSTDQVTIEEKKAWFFFPWDR